MVYRTDLQILSDILRQCKSTNQAILKKLPEYSVTRLSCQIQGYRDSTGIYPQFATFSDFIARQARLACDSITSFQALNDDKTSKSTNIKSKGTDLSTKTEHKEKLTQGK